MQKHIRFFVNFGFWKPVIKAENVSVDAAAQLPSEAEVIKQIAAVIPAPIGPALASLLQSGLLGYEITDIPKVPAVTLAHVDTVK